MEKTKKLNKIKELQLEEVDLNDKKVFQRHSTDYIGHQYVPPPVTTTGPVTQSTRPVVACVLYPSLPYPPATTTGIGTQPTWPASACVPYNVYVWLVRPMLFVFWVCALCCKLAG